MKISTSFVALAFAIAPLVAAVPAEERSSLELAALEARANSPECLYGNVQGQRCDTQGCRDGGGYCQYNQSTKRCVQVNMRGSGAPVGCQYCTCIKA